MFGKKYSRLLGLSLVTIFMMAMVIGAAQAQDETVLVIGWEQEPPKLSPVGDNTFGSLIDGFTRRDIWDWDTSYNVFPVMVEEVPSIENGLVTTNDAGNTVVTYKLREGMLWSDGEPITTADCAITHEIMMDPTTGSIQRGAYPDVVESFEAVDDYTVRLTYNTPFPDFENNATAACGQFPEHVFRAILDGEGNFDNAPFFSGEGVVGYGPYTFESWTVGSQITLVKNPNWDGQEPAFDRIVLRFITDTAQMVNSFEAGEIDVAFNFSDDLVESYAAVEGAEIFKTDGVYGDAIWMNVGNGGHVALADPKVREGIIRAVDRESLAVDLVGEGVSVPPSWKSPQYWPEDLPFWSYDPDMAAALLDEAGWVDSNGDGTRDKDGVELVLRFYTTTRQIRMDYQTVIQEYLTAVGVGTQLLPVPSNILFGEFKDRGILNTGDFDLAIFALSTNPLSPAYDTADWFGCGGIPTAENPNGSNGWGMCVPEFDALDLQILSTVDPAERLALSHQAQQLFFDAGVWHGLYLRPTWYAVDGSVVAVDDAMQGVGTLSSNWFNNIEKWQAVG
jgi:peptide/nickel transport system substrate-binding protein